MNLSRQELLANIIQLVKDTFQAWNEDKARLLAAALAYYAIFSVTPLLVLLVVLGGQILGQGIVRAYLEIQISEFITPGAAETLLNFIDNAWQPRESRTATIISIAVALVGASGVFRQLREALDTIWHVAPAPRRSILLTLREWLVSIFLVLGIGPLLVITIVANTLISLLGDSLAAWLPGSNAASSFAYSVLFFILLVLLFALLFKILPRVYISWRDVTIGAMVTAVLFTLGHWFLSFYLRVTSVGSAYGTAGSLVVLVVWVYYSAQVFLLGAEFTKVYANRYGSRIVPGTGAVGISFELNTKDEEAAAG